MRNVPLDGNELVERYQKLISTHPRKRAFLDWEGMGFEFAFVWFKPFVRVHSVKVDDYQPAVNARFRNPRGLPFKELEEIAIREGEIWSREFIASELGVDIASIEAGLVAHWSGYQNEPRIQRIGKDLLDYLATNNLIEPMDLSICPVESLSMADILRDAGYGEFHSFTLVPSGVGSGLWIHPLDNNSTLDNNIRGAFVSEPHATFFMHTGYNDFSIVIHGNGKLKSAIERHPMMEGFFCNEYTDEAWLDEPEKSIGRLKKIAPPTLRADRIS